MLSGLVGEYAGDRGWSQEEVIEAEIRIVLGYL